MFLYIKYQSSTTANFYMTTFHIVQAYCTVDMLSDCHLEQRPKLTKNNLIKHRGWWVYHIGLYFEVALYFKISLYFKELA